MKGSLDNITRRPRTEEAKRNCAVQFSKRSIAPILYLGDLAKLSYTVTRKVECEKFNGREKLYTYLFFIMPGLSLISFAIYGWDKWCAIKGKSRIRETTLHIWDVVGGWPGGLAGQRCFRHKNRKVSFQVKFWSVVVLNVVVLMLLLHYFG